MYKPRSLGLLTILTFLLIGSAVNASAIPAPDAGAVASYGGPIESLDVRSNGAQCKGKKLKRKAWHNMSKPEKKSYLNAELCLMWQKPSRTDIPFTQTLYDDLLGTHQVQMWNVHWTGYFLAYHRLLMYTHEKLLRDECGYKGAQPYWDEPWEADRGDLESSPLFDPVYGFGGNGRGANYTWSFPPFIFNSTARCITDGPFANATIHLGPGLNQGEDHCISRSFNQTSILSSSQENVDRCNLNQNFTAAWRCFEDTGPHGGGHAAVGGEMMNPLSSPGDPLFYLHHSWLDKVWWDWQMIDPVKRSKEIGGDTNPWILGPPADGSDPVPVKAEDHISVFGLTRNYTLGEVTDIRNGLLSCVEYV